MSIQIQVQASYGHPHLAPLISVFEGNLDFDSVEVRRSEYAVKAFVPLELVINAASIYLLEKLILAPLIDPMAEKFNWAAGVRKYLEPAWPFRLTIHLSEESLVIQADLETQHKITAQIWSIIQRVLAILRDENRLSTINKIQMVPDQGGQPLIMCYSGNRPKYTVELTKKKTLEITASE